MKIKKIVMIILLALLVIVGIEGMISFGSNHSYYLAMIFSWKNLALISGAIGSAYLPLTFITSKTKLSFKRLILGIGAGLGTFVVLHGIFTKSLITLFAIIPLLFNTFLLYGLAITFIIAITRHEFPRLINLILKVYLFACILDAFRHIIFRAFRHIAHLVFALFSLLHGTACI